MPRVRFGCLEAFVNNTILYIPSIVVEAGTENLTYILQGYLDSKEEAFELSTLVYEALTGAQKNLRIDPEGMLN